MTTKKTIGMLAIALTLILSTGFVAAYQFGGFNNPTLTDGERTEVQEFHEQIRQAVENGDYDSWKALHNAQLTEERFSQVQERYEQMTEIRELRENLRDAIDAEDTELTEQIKGELSELSPNANDFGRRHTVGKENRAFNQGFKRGFRTALSDCPFNG